MIQNFQDFFTHDAVHMSIYSFMTKENTLGKWELSNRFTRRSLCCTVAGPERHLARLPAQNKPLAHCLLRMVTNAPWQIQWNNKIMFMPCKWYKHVKVWEWEKNMFSDCARKGKRKDMKNHCLNRYFSFFLRQRAMDPAPPDSVTKYSVQIGSKLVISVINNHNVIWSLRPEYVTLML